MTKRWLLGHKRLSFLRTPLQFLGLTLLSLLLLVMIASSPLPQTTQAQEDWITLFQDNFEEGNADDWALESGWGVELKGSNYVLSGSGHNWATLSTGDDWTDYSFKTKVKLIEGSSHLNYRQSDNGRYFIGFHAGGLGLSKEAPWGTFYDLASDGVSHSFNTWYDV